MKKEDKDKDMSESPAAAPLELYTLKQSVQRLGNMTPTEFYRLVKRENIKTVVPMGKKSKLYAKEDVERIAQVIEDFHRKYRLVDD
jgi:hypothetical protein